MHAVGVPGVGEERPELTQAEELGMRRGAELDEETLKRLVAKFALGGGGGNGYF